MDVTVLLGAALTCALGGVFPWIAADAAVVGAALLLPPEALPALAILCGTAQMGAKSGLYALARWSPERLPAKAHVMLARASELRARHRRAIGLAVFTGALTSVPPFYLVTVACGTTRVPFSLFATAGLAGNVIRYGAVAWAAQAITAI